MLTHELNNFTMQEAVNWYPRLKAAFSVDALLFNAMTKNSNPFLLFTSTSFPLVLLSTRLSRTRRRTTLCPPSSSVSVRSGHHSLGTIRWAHHIPVLCSCFQISLGRLLSPVTPRTAHPTRMRVVTPARVQAINSRPRLSSGCRPAVHCGLSPWRGCFSPYSCYDKPWDSMGQLELRNHRRCDRGYVSFMI